MNDTDDVRSSTTTTMTTYDTLVFSGGGPLSVAFVGCIRYLEEVGAMDAVRTCVGTSAGSVIALSCVLGMTANDMDRWLRELRDSDAFSLDVENILELVDRFGVDDGRRLMDVVRNVLNKHGYGEHVTFADLKKRSGKELVVCAVNVNRARHEYFSATLTPGFGVVTAIRMSIGVPILYTPVMHDGCMYVDGGLLNNCPSDYVVRAHDRGETHNRRVLALDAASIELANACVGITDFVDYLSVLLRIVIGHANANNACDDSRLPEGVRIDRVRLVADAKNAFADSINKIFSFEDLKFPMDDPFLEERMQMGYAALKRHLMMTDEEEAKTTMTE